MNLSTLKKGDILWCKGIPTVIVAVSSAFMEDPDGNFTALVIVYNSGKLIKLSFKGKVEDAWNNDGTVYQGIAYMCDEKSVSKKVLWEDSPVPLWDKMIEDEINSALL